MQAAAETLEVATTSRSLTNFGLGLPLVALLLTVLFWFVWSSNKKKNIPPGPSPWPVVGNLLSLGAQYDWPIKMYQRYGKIYSLYFGSQLSVFITDPELAKEAFVNKASIYSSRIIVPSMMIVTEGKDIAMSEGEHWKTYRRLLMVSLTKMKLKVSENHIHEQINDLFKGLAIYGDTGKPVELSMFMINLTMNVATSLCFSLSTPQDPQSKVATPVALMKALSAIMNHLGPNNIYDFLTWLTPFYRSSIKELKDAVAVRNECLEKIIDDHLDKLDKENPRDLADVMLIETLSQGYGKNELLPILSDVLIAGTDTSAATLLWFFAYVLHENYWEKLENEVNKAFPEGVLPNYNERDKTPLTCSFLKEVMRVRPVGPLALPHRITEDDTLGGYFIPKDTQVFLNIIGIHHRDDLWENPQEFRPERFMDNLTESRGTDFQHLPFSVGLRICPGLNLALVEMYLLIIRVFQTFQFSLPKGESIDFDPIVGLSLQPKPYDVVITHRKK